MSAALRPTCACGCGGLTSVIKSSHKGRGLVRGEYYRYIAGHQTRKSPREYLVDAEGCWVWQRSRLPTGYGHRKVDGRQVYAHRWFYEQARGTIPDGYVIDHLCRNPSCVNPDHLEAVPPRVNSLRGDKTRLTRSQVRALRSDIASGATTVEVAARFGISVSYCFTLATGLRRAADGGPITENLPRRYRRSGCVTKETVSEIRARRERGERNRSIAADLGLSESYVSQIATGALERRHGS